MLSMCSSTVLYPQPCKFIYRKLTDLPSYTDSTDFNSELATPRSVPSQVLRHYPYFRNGDCAPTGQVKRKK
jgi:hypothetical protein